MLFYPVFHAIVFILQNKKSIYLCYRDLLIFYFAFRFSLVNYFFAFSLLVFQTIVLL